MPLSFANVGQSIGGGQIGTYLGLGNYPQHAQQIAQQQAAFVQQMNQQATATLSTGLITGGTVGLVGLSSSTNSTNFYIGNSTFSSYSSPAPDFEAGLDTYAEDLLQRKLDREKQMLLKWQRMALLPKLNFVHLKTPYEVMEMPLHTHEVEGYLLHADKTYVLPDGSTLTIDPHGNYGINDESAKVIYQACRRREFNPYLNASDLLVSFVKEVGAIDGVNQDEVLRLPIEAFINWLVLQAATKDGESIKGLPTVKDALRLCSPVATF